MLDGPAIEGGPRSSDGLKLSWVWIQAWDCWAFGHYQTGLKFLGHHKVLWRPLGIMRVSKYISEVGQMLMRSDVLTVTLSQALVRILKLGGPFFSKLGSVCFAPQKILSFSSQKVEGSDCL